MANEISWEHDTLRPRQNGRHFPDGIFICIFLNANVYILIKFTDVCSYESNWQHFSIGSDNGLAPGTIIWTNNGYSTDAYMRHSASMS